MSAVPERCVEQTDKWHRSYDRGPHGREERRVNGGAADVVGADVRRQMNHGGPHDGPDQPENGQRIVAGVVRYVWYDDCAEHVPEEPAEHCAGEHERRV